jgi:hypothetical protein
VTGERKCFFAATNVLLAAHDCYDWAVVRSSSGPLQLGNVRGAATSCFISSFRLFLSPFLHTHRRTDRQTHVDYTLDSFGAFFRFPSTVFFLGFAQLLPHGTHLVSNPKDGRTLHLHRARCWSGCLFFFFFFPSWWKPSLLKVGGRDVNETLFSWPFTKRKSPNRGILFRLSPESTHPCRLLLLRSFACGH